MGLVTGIFTYIYLHENQKMWTIHVGKYTWMVWEYDSKCFHEWIPSLVQMELWYHLHDTSVIRLSNARVFNIHIWQLFVNARFVAYSMFQIWSYMKLNTLGQPCKFLLRQSKRSWTVAGWHCTANEVGGTIFVDLGSFFVYLYDIHSHLTRDR